MKKTLFLVLTIIFLLPSTNVMANISCTYEELTGAVEPNLDISSDESINKVTGVLGFDKPSVYRFKNDIYCVKRDSLPVKLTGERISGPDCIWTGQYYYMKSSAMDGLHFQYNGSKYAYPLCLYDENWNLVKKFDLKNTFKQHALRIGYLDGTYYCSFFKKSVNGVITEETVIKSTDFEKWEETTEDLPQIFECVTIRGEEISFNNIDFSSVLYENDTEKNGIYGLGDMLIKVDKDMNFYLTKDNVYFTKIEYPSELKTIDEAKGYRYEVRCIYELNDKVIIDMSRRKSNSTSIIGTLRLSVDNEDFYSGVVEKEETAYVKMNGSYLGFAVPPVIEDDRTLVPMRFVFEQMGATVDWDEATESATATLNNSAVTFSIDNTTADVNNTAVTMDVPARLINDKTMVPLRFLSENLGLTVTWDEETRTATIE